MSIVFSIIIFIVGSFLGSIYATQIRRVSKDKPALNIHSYCSNCGKKLGILEKIPIISYICLRGKCKHCKKNIEKIYITLEMVTGIVLLLTTLAFEINITNIDNLVVFIFIILYYTYVILSIGIDLEKRETNQSIMAYGVAISTVYMIYLWLNNSTTIYINTIYLIIIILLLLLNIVKTKKTAQSSYVLDLLMMLVIMNIFTNELACILTIGATLLTIALYIIINKFKNRKPRDNGKFSNNIRIAAIMGILNILTFLILINV